MSFGVEIQVDTEQAKVRLARVNQRLNEKEYLTLIGMALMRWVDQNFRKEGIETKWKPLAVSTILRRRKGRGRGGPMILQDTGRLKMSFTHWMSLTGDWVAVGSEDPRSLWHHKGTRSKRGNPHLPARPLLPTERTAMDIAVSTMKAYVNTIVREANQ